MLSARMANPRTTTTGHELAALGSRPLGELIVAKARLAMAVHMAEAARMLATDHNPERSVTPDGGTGVPVVGGLGDGGEA